MQKNKYQKVDLTGLAVGLITVALISSLTSYVISTTNTIIATNITTYIPAGCRGAPADTTSCILNESQTILGNNGTVIFNLGGEAFKTFTQFLPVIAIGTVAVLLIGLFIKSKLTE